jgi:sulfofructose kinase
MHDWDVVGVGAVSVDVTGTVPHWPEPGSKLQLEDLEVCDGGLVGTALVAVSRLGGRSCFLGRMGYSEWALRAVEQLDREGVDTSLVIRENGAGPHFAMVLTLQSDGQRTIFYSKSAVRYPDSGLIPADAWLGRTRVFLFDSGSGLGGLSLAREARRAGTPVVIDAEQISPELDALLECTDHIVIPETLASEIHPDWNREADLRRLCLRADQTVVVTLGADGCIASSPEEGVCRLPAYSVEVVDTTGCGDVFHGAYALGVARGLDLEARCRLASAAAALAATRLGGRAGIPTGDDLLSFLSER